MGQGRGEAKAFAKSISLVLTAAWKKGRVLHLSAPEGKKQSRVAGKGLEKWLACILR